MTHDTDDVAAEAGFEFDPAILDPPWPFHEQLRKHAPVCKIDALGFWLVTRHADVAHIFKNPQTFSSHFPHRMGAGFSFQPRTAAKEAALAKGYKWEPTLFFTDAPEHRRQRALVQQAFSPNRVRQIEGDIRQLAQEIADELVECAEFDFARQVAFRLPVMVISDALGIDPSDREQFMHWADSVMVRLGEPLTEEQDLPLIDDFVEAQHYFAEKVAARREKPTDDLLSDLVHAQLESEHPLTLEELLSIATLLPVAGSETSTGLIGLTLLHLLETPDDMARCRHDPEFINSVIEETLRKESPVQAWFRMAATDVELSGTTIPAGEMILVVIGSANRDEDVFACPAEFRADRPNINEHLAFGRGPHFCIGASLARTEARLMIETMLSRFSSIEIAPGATAKHRPNLVHRSLDTLPIVVRS